MGGGHPAPRTRARALMTEPRIADFRAVCRTLFRSQVLHHALDLKAKRLELVIVPADHETSEPRKFVFEGITQFRWQSDSPVPYDRMELSIVGLERLAADDVWRLYASPGHSGTLELSCAGITCDGSEVHGVGRHYEDGRPARASISGPSA